MVACTHSYVQMVYACEDAHRVAAYVYLLMERSDFTVAAKMNAALLEPWKSICCTQTEPYRNICS